MNCQGCGVELDPSEEQVNPAVDQILETSLKHAEKTGGVCPLCGHCKGIPISQKKSVLVTLLLACFFLLGAGALGFWQWRQTERTSVIKAAIARMSANADVVWLIGTPITAQPEIKGDVRHDETGWKEARLIFPARGSKGQAQVQIVAGKGSGAWVFTTFEVDFEQQHKKLDLISGRIVDYDPSAYIEVHTQSAVLPENNSELFQQHGSTATFLASPRRQEARMLPRNSELCHAHNACWVRESFRSRFTGRKFRSARDGFARQRCLRCASYTLIPVQ